MLSNLFEDPLSQMRDLTKPDKAKIFTIQREIGYMRTLSMSAIRLASNDTMCKRDHQPFWSYWAVESTSYTCKLRSRDCIIERIQYADRTLTRYLPDSRWFLISDEELEVALTTVLRIKMLFYQELIEACTSALRNSLQLKTSQAAHFALQLFGHLTQSLWNIMNSKSYLLLPEEAQMKVDEEKLRIVGVLICFVYGQSIEQKELEDILSQFGPTADYLASLCYLPLIIEMDRSMKRYIHGKLIGLLQQIELGDRIHLLGFVDLLLQNLTQLPNFNGQVGILNREVKMLMKFVANLHEEDFENKKLSDLLAQIEDLACKLISIFYSLFYADDIAEEVHTNFSKFLEEVNIIKVEFKDIYPKSAGRVFSKIDGIIFIDFFLDNLKELLANNRTPTSLVNHEVETIQRNLEWFRSFLKATRHHNDEHEVLNDLILRCINVAYDAESMIDTLFIDDAPSWDNMLWLADVMEEMEHIKIEVTEIFDKNNLKIIDANFINAEEASPIMSTLPTDSDLPSFFSQNKAVVGFKDVEDQINQLLIRDNSPPKLDVISIFGMPGLGKTTLAERVFNHGDIVRRFRNFRLFCRVSEVYKKRELLLGMLRQLDKIPDKIDKKSDADLADILRKSLSGERYLIVVDDVWSTKAWDDLQKAFPKQEHDSRVLLTTRDQSVASHAKTDSDPIHLRFLTEDESWELLQQRTFKNDSCPMKLLEVGKRIADNCRGLPLSIVLIAGVLGNKEKTLSFWSKVADNFESQTKSFLEHSMDTIDLSFKHLPEHLKPCFLYFAAFPEDKEIRVQKLMRLWIAERFIPLTKETTLENVAKEYLMNLTSRGLAIVAKRSFTKGVKTIFIHDLIREFCIAKAEEGNFLLLLRRDNHLYQSSPNSYLCRLSTYSRKIQITEEMDSLRSLLWYSGRDYLFHEVIDHDIGYSVSRKLQVVEYFKLLRVLDLGVSIDDNTFRVICLLIHLRYLGVQNLQNIGSSIANLRKLQTLCVEEQLRVTSVSDRLWELKALRHIYFELLTDFEFGESFSNSAEFSNIDYFSKPVLCWDEEDMTRKMPNLRTLKCLFKDSWGYSSKSSKQCNRLPQLEHLTKLESLDAYLDVPELTHKYLLPYEFNLPSNLKKLTLSLFRIPWNEMSTIANSLPNLEVLKLFHEAFEGETWEMKDEIFPKLKFLKLDYLQLARWSLSDEAFPKLECLVFVQCWNLKEIPFDFCQSCTLQTIEVHGCQPSLVQSALELKENFAADWGIDDFQVIFS